MMQRTPSKTRTQYSQINKAAKKEYYNQQASAGAAYVSG